MTPPGASTRSRRGGNSRYMKREFVLVEPALPENIGAAARAIKTMGEGALVLVNPACSLTGKARWVAHGATDILESAPIYGSVADAIAGADISVATTSKQRSVRCDPVVSGSLYHFLDDRVGSTGRVAILFGREESGLTNDAIRLCDISSYIPMRQSYPSLNLGQAVMIYAYEMSRHQLTTPSGGKAMPAEVDDAPLSHLKAMAGEIVEGLGIPVSDARYGRIMERISLLSRSDRNLMLTIAARISMREEPGSGRGDSEES